jgi:hypothetical protein
MIDVAEKIFVKIAEAIFKNKFTIRKVWLKNIEIAEIDGQEYEILSPEGFIEGIEELGLNDIKEKEMHYLLKVLSKPELEGHILM